MKYIHQILFLMIGFTFITGCKMINNENAVNAMIEKHSKKSLAELHFVINQAIGNGSVFLSDKALTTSHQIIIERKQHRSIEQGILMGRSDEKPNVFHLILKNKQCFLVHQQSKKHWLLQHAICQPETIK